ncbi:MAG: hypothetical protein R3Y24_14555 [Eubacteriales bacterium]
MFKKITLNKKIVLRVMAILLMIFSVIFSLRFDSFFSSTWENGYCIGDNILSSVGLKAWSSGTSGTHYTVIYSLVMLLLSFAAFSSTAQKKALTFMYFLTGFLVLFFIANIAL